MTLGASANISKADVFLQRTKKQVPLFIVKAELSNFPSQTLEFGLPLRLGTQRFEEGGVGLGLLLGSEMLFLGGVERKGDAKISKHHSVSIPYPQFLSVPKISLTAVFEPIKVLILGCYVSLVLF